MVKAPECKACGETNKDEFYSSNKVMCKTCLAETRKAEREKIQKLMEKVASPKPKSPKPMSPSKDLEKIIEAQNIRIASLEANVLELYEQIANMFTLLEKKEEVQNVKIVSPVKCELPLPLPVVQEKVKSPPKVKTPVKRSTKEKEEIKENIENLESKTVKELTELAKKYGLPVPLNRRGKEARIEDLKKFLS
jgi:hypothetical protein